MNILNLIDILEDEIENSPKVPFATKTLLDSDKCLEIIKDIRLSLPEEIKQAEWIKKEKNRILVEAQNEADIIIKEAEQRLKSLIDESEITKNAHAQSREIIEGAQANAKDIRIGAKEYADSILEEVEGYLTKQIDILQDNRKELKTKKR